MAIGQFSEPNLIRQSETKLLDDGAHAARIGFWTLVLGLGGFLLWASLAPLDEGVPSHGMIALDTKRKAVQHLTGGIVREVFVREGDLVKEGQLLIKLDAAIANANHQAVRQRYLGLRAAEARLLAEQGGQPQIKLHPDLAAAAKDPGIAQQIHNQVQLLNARRSALAADLQGMEESIRGLDGVVKSYDGMLISRKNQAALLNEELGSFRELVREGYAPRNRQLELERMVAESITAQTELIGNTLRARQSIAETRQRMISRQQEYRKDVETQLADATREVQSDAERIKAAADEMSRTDINAPSAGQVIGLNFQTVGGVIPPGQKIMDIVPENETLLVEAKVTPNLIDRVEPGLAVDIRFASFAHTPQLVVAGKVTSVSKDLLSEPPNNVPFYLARVSVTAEGLKTLGKRQMQPGMPAEVVFKTGERSLLNYLLHPLTKRMAASMKEE